MQERYSLRTSGVTLSAAGLSVMLVVLAFVVSDGLYIIDEFMTLAITEALSVRGELNFQNGYEQFGSPNLLLWQFVNGPHGLVSQYPDGAAVLGAALYDLLGIRGLILLNALAAAATLFITRELARHWFQTEIIALSAALLLALGTFWLEFAVGIWPHSLSTMCVTAALLLAIKAMGADVRLAAKYALLSGMAVGAGLLLRVDSLLILPPIGLCVLLFARHALPVFAAGALGVFPGVLVMAFVNDYKFGSYNPFSYGGSGGYVDFISYLPMIGAIALSALMALLVRRIPTQQLSGKYLVLTGVLAVAIGLVVPSVRGFVWSYAYGFWALMVDSGVIVDPRPGITANDDGVLYFWGFVKKALGQSLPWLGVLLVLAVKPFREQHKRAIAITSIVFGVWTLPFVAKAWHGGLGSNMRYFLPLLPLLCVMGSAAWYKLLSIAGNSLRSALLPGAAAGLLAIMLWAWVGPSKIAGAQQIFSTYLLLASCVACLLVMVANGRQQIAARVAQPLVAAGLSAALVFGLMDFSSSQARRKMMASNSQILSSVPAPNLFIGPPEMFTFQIGRPKGLIALPSTRISNEMDSTLIRAAIEDGYSVYAPVGVAVALAKKAPTFVAGPRYIGLPGAAFLEISLQHQN